MFLRRLVRSMVLTTVAIIALGLLAAGCVDEQAVPIDPANPPTTPSPDVADMPDVSHPLQPTDQMKELARQQCIDDPDLVEGYVSAVDPETDDIVVDYAVQCVEVRP